MRYRIKQKNMRHKVSFTLLILFSLVAFTVKGQIIQGEVIGGFNFSKVEGDRVNNGMFKFNKPGVQVGVGAAIPLGHNFSTTFEILFNQKGAYKKYGQPDSARPMYLTRLNYAEIPVLIQYTDKGKYTFGLGASYSRLVGVKWIVNGRTLGNSINDGYYARDNFDWIANFRFRIYQQLKMDIRYAYSLTSIWSGTEDQLLETIGGVKQDMNQNNSMITFRVVWVFNEEKSIKNLDKSKNAK